MKNTATYSVAGGGIGGVISESVHIVDLKFMILSTYFPNLAIITNTIILAMIGALVGYLTNFFLNKLRRKYFQK